MTSCLRRKRCELRQERTLGLSVQTWTSNFFQTLTRKFDAESLQVALVAVVERDFLPQWILVCWCCREHLSACSPTYADTLPARVTDRESPVSFSSTRICACYRPSQPVLEDPWLIRGSYNTSAQYRKYYLISLFTVVIPLVVSSITRPRIFTQHYLTDIYLPPAGYHSSESATLLDTLIPSCVFIHRLNPITHCRYGKRRWTWLYYGYECHCPTTTHPSLTKLVLCLT
jgi:hypothetical protein